MNERSGLGLPYGGGSPARGNELSLYTLERKPISPGKDRSPQTFADPGPPRDIKKERRPPAIYPGPSLESKSRIHRTSPPFELTRLPALFGVYPITAPCGDVAPPVIDVTC